MGGRRLSRDLRLLLCREVRDLHSKGFSYRRIQAILREKYGVEVSRSNISYWVRGLHVPEREPYNRPDLSREKDLAWIAGMFAGDGSVKVNRKGRFLSLKVKDRELAEEAARRLAIVMGRDKPYAVGRLGDGRYYVEVQSRELVDHLMDRRRILAYLDRRPREFIQAFFDCEGSISGSVSAHGHFVYYLAVLNTDLNLLEGMKVKLEDMGIGSSLRLHYPAGKVVITGKGKTVARKGCYALEIRDPLSLDRFHQIIGSVIKRKRKKLADVVDIVEKFGHTRRAALEWIRRYKYVRGKGRERWFRRKELLGVKEAETELENHLKILRRTQSPKRETHRTDRYIST